MPGLVSALRRRTRLFLLSLGFLTRLGPALPAGREELRACTTCYPLAGAALGLALVAPLSLFLFLLKPDTAGLAEAEGPLLRFCLILVAAWLYAFLNIWLTRALHLDGLADLLDALGSGKRGPDFQAVLKDSRLGVFGVTGLITAITGQILLGSACLAKGSLAALFFAPLFGRCLPAIIARTVPINPGAGLGALLADAPRAGLAASGGGMLLAAFFCLNGKALLVCALALACLVSGLARLARREGGCNGDYFGFAVVFAELAFLFCAVLSLYS